MRWYDFSAMVTPAWAFCHISYAAWICSSRAPLIAFAFCACAAASAARACSIFATTSGASKMASVSPALTLWPSFTRNSSIRPGTLLETRYSVTSACPCIISGPLRSMKKPTTATIAITPNRVRNARSILLFCDFIGAIWFMNYDLWIVIYRLWVG